MCPTPAKTFRLEKEVSEINRKVFALVAQGIERLVAVQKVAGSIPAGRTKEKEPTSVGSFSLVRSTERTCDLLTIDAGSFVLPA